ncbi:MAG TPA: hypothetical protein ENI27_02415, partial [bacterium]|nr:hypothetical protein [bacterium]
MPPHSWDIHGLIDTCSNCGESRQWDKTRTNFVVINKGTSTCKAVPTKDFDPTKRKPGRPPATAGRPAGTEAPAPVQEAAGTPAASADPEKVASPKEEAQETAATPVQEAAEAPAPEKEEAAPAPEAETKEPVAETEDSPLVSSRPVALLFPSPVPSSEPVKASNLLALQDAFKDVKYGNKFALMDKHKDAIIVAVESMGMYALDRKLGLRRGATESWNRLHHIGILPRTGRRPKPRREGERKRNRHGRKRIFVNGHSVDTVYTKEQMEELLVVGVEEFNKRYKVKGHSKSGTSRMYNRLIRLGKTPLAAEKEKAPAETAVEKKLPGPAAPKPGAPSTLDHSLLPGQQEYKTGEKALATSHALAVAAIKKLMELINQEVEVFKSDWVEKLGDSAEEGARLDAYLDARLEYFDC